MASITRSPPNHYEVLGLSPTASEDEIAKAFRKAMGLFGAHSAAGAAQLAFAFETLRNPEKRRAYDDSIGLNRHSERPPMALSFRISAQPHAAQASAGEPHVEPRSLEPLTPSAIASSLREIARPVDVDPSRRPAVQPRPRPPQPPLTALWEEQAGEADGRPIEWKRPVVAIGAVVLAAGLIGAFAGVSVRGDEQGQGTVTKALPPPKAQTQIATPIDAVPAIATDLAAATVKRPVRSPLPDGRAERPDQAPAASPDLAQAPADTEAPAMTDAAAADPLAPQADSAIATVAVAGLPVAARLVARTIDRIGYACGEVASTSAVDGAAGVYKVTCTSGQSYRAAPVHGRYRFRRWDSR